MKVMVETSAHHVHVSEADLETLFGKGAALTNKKDLSQPGQFACEEKVEVVDSRALRKMSILGPTRPETQVEISLTDARKLGLTAPIRESGDLEGTPGCTLRGPAGEVTIEKGVIAAKRHIHFNPDEAKEAGRGGQAGGLCQGGLQRPRPDLRRRGVPGQPQVRPGHARGH